MPKKTNWGENTKAVEAKARKAVALKSEQDKKLREAEDAYWEDDDKSLAKKQNRKDDKEKKRLEKLDRKTTNKQLVEEETIQVAAKIAKAAPAKITQAEIAAENERREAAARKANASIPKVPKQAPIEENLNRLLQPEDEARTVDEALKMLKITNTQEELAAVDRHPERRMKAAYAAFEEARLPQVKAENPSLRLTQLKQIIFTEWKKSPENPFNQEKV